MSCLCWRGSEFGLLDWGKILCLVLISGIGLSFSLVKKNWRKDGNEENIREGCFVLFSFIFIPFWIGMFAIAIVLLLIIACFVSSRDRSMYFQAWGVSLLVSLVYWFFFTQIYLFFLLFLRDIFLSLAY